MIYKSVAPDGVVEFSAAPPPGNRVIQRIQIRDLTPEHRRAASSLRRTEGETGTKASTTVAARERKLDEADVEVRRAHGAFLVAERALETGREPLPGERRGTVGGHSRLTQEYFDRLEKLEKAVEQAQARLNAAYRARREASD